MYFSSCFTPPSGISHIKILNRKGNMDHHELAERSKWPGAPIRVNLSNISLFLKIHLFESVMGY